MQPGGPPTFAAITAMQNGPYGLGEPSKTLGDATNKAVAEANHNR